MFNHFVYVVFADGCEPETFDPRSHEFSPPLHTARRAAMSCARMLREDGASSVRIEMHHAKRAKEGDYEHPVAVVSLESAKPGAGPGSYSFLGAVT